MPAKAKSEIWNGAGLIVKLVVVMVPVLFGIFTLVHAIQNNRLTKVENTKSEKEMCARTAKDVGEIRMVLHGEGGMLEILNRIDERMKILYEKKAQSRKRPSNP